MKELASNLGSPSLALKGPNKSAQGNALGDRVDPENRAAQGFRTRISPSAGFTLAFATQVFRAFQATQGVALG